jgi:hypothetical protein
MSRLEKSGGWLERMQGATQPALQAKGHMRH